MTKVHKLITALVLASAASAMSVAHADTPTANRAVQFRATESAMQQESTNMPYDSVPVDRSTPSIDPIPHATTGAEKAARFAGEERAMQDESTNMSYGAPPANKTTSAADPIAPATTRAQKAARFAAEEQAMQQESTR